MTVRPIEVPCGHCGSDPGQHCRTSYASGRNPTSPHQVRHTLAAVEGLRRAAGMTTHGST